VGAQRVERGGESDEARAGDGSEVDLRLGVLSML
jgi:hypothetical protein